MQLFSLTAIEELHEAVLASGATREALLGGISHHFAATLSTRTRPSEQILSDLHALNAIGVLPDRTDPFETWLRNAKMVVTSARAEHEVFVFYMIVLGKRRASPRDDDATAIMTIDDLRRLNEELLADEQRERNAETSIISFESQKIMLERSKNIEPGDVYGSPGRSPGTKRSAGGPHPSPAPQRTAGLQTPPRASGRSEPKGRDLRDRSAMGQDVGRVNHLVVNQQDEIGTNTPLMSLEQRAPLVSQVKKEDSYAGLGQMFHKKQHVDQTRASNLSDPRIRGLSSDSSGSQRSTETRGDASVREEPRSDDMSDLDFSGLDEPPSIQGAIVARPNDGEDDDVLIHDIKSILMIPGSK
ncbi:MAG: hypothetical protein U0359_05280 [Byssovorax sp.]